MPLDENENEIIDNDASNIPESTESAPESVEESVRRSILEVGANEVAKETGEDPERTASDEKPEKEEESEATKAARTLAALKNKAKTGEKITEQGKKRVVEAKDFDPVPKAKAAPTQVKDRLDPPQRFPIDRKEWFNKQPRALQEQVLKDWNEWEGQATKTFQEASRYTNEAKNVAAQLGGVMDVVRQHAPGWAKRGIAPAQAILESSQLIADVTNPETAPGAILDLCNKAGFTLQQLYQYQQSGGQSVRANPAPQQQENKYLTKDDFYKMQQEQQQLFQQNATIQELAKLQNAVKQDGTYFYPELHDAGSIERLKPLTERARKNQPGAGWTDWTKTAIAWDRQLQGAQGLPSSSSVGLSGGNSNQQNIQEIKRASLSTKQRGAPSVPTIANGKANEKMDDTIRRSIAEVKAKYGN